MLLVQSLIVIIVGMFIVDWLSQSIPLIAAFGIAVAGLLLFFGVGIILTRRSRRRLEALPGTNPVPTSKWGET